MWCVLQVKGNQELGIQEQLINAGYKALVPRENRIIRTNGNWTHKEYLLFPNYVFVETDYEADDFYRIQKINGVQRFLGDKRSPSSLTFIEEEWIKLLSNDNRPLEPTVVEVDENGQCKILKGILLNFKSRIKNFDKRHKRAKFAVTVCNEEKEIALSFDVIQKNTTEKPKETSG